MRELIVLLSAILVVLLNGYIGHHYPTSGIMGTPIILGISSLIIVLGARKSASVLKSCFIIFCALFNDYLLRKYSGGIHDSEGASWISMYFFYGLIASYLILIFGTVTSKDKKINKIIAWSIFPLVVFLYWLIR
ncbi:hypothetical protein D3C87_83840 [compost metagenome]